jgi:hypothetical protein
MGLDTIALLLYYYVSIFIKLCIGFLKACVTDDRCEGVCCTVSAVISKISQEVIDIFVEPILKRQEMMERSADHDCVASRITEQDSK